MPLNDDILRIFQQACAEGDTEVAEELLQALEIIDRRNGGDDLEPCLASAYLVLADAPANLRQLQRRRALHASDKSSPKQGKTE